MKKTLLSLAGVLLLFGCAASTGVVADEKGTFTVFRKSMTGLAGMNELKAESIAEASRFCEGRGRVLQVVGVHESEPPYYILTEHPEIEIQFMCSDSKNQGLSISSR